MCVGEVKCGVPPVILSVIRSFRDGMKAEVRAGSRTTGCIVVKNGLRQGCTLAPSLFNVYLSAMITHWRARCLEVGVPVLYKLGRKLKLVGDRTAKSCLKAVKITESLLADDAVYATTRGAFEHQSLSIQRPSGA